MSSKKTIVVVGATGRQGGSVARTFVGLPNWHVRAMTRDPSSEAAQALKAKGAEVVQADLADPATLTTAFANAQAIFLNTDFFTFFYPAMAKLKGEGKDVASASQQAFDTETTYGRNAVVAAAAVPTLERIVYSSIPSVSTDGKYSRSLHPESKNWIVDFIRTEHPALVEKLSIIYLGAYATNRLIQPMLDEGSGEYKMLSPIRKDVHLPVIDPTRSTGPFVQALIEDEEIGTQLFAYDSDLSLIELMETWCKVTGKKAEFVPVTTQQMHERGALWEHLDAVDFINKHNSYEDLIPGVIRPDQLKRKIVTKSYEEWLKENA